MVPDMDKAVRFYTEALSLLMKARKGKEFAVVEAPDPTIGLHPAPTERSPRAHLMSIGLSVELLERTMKQLWAPGVLFISAIGEDPPIRVAYFPGPGGTPLYLVAQCEWR